MPAAPDPESAEWLRALRATGSERLAAERRLHTLLLRAARAEVARRNVRATIPGAELDDLAEQAADDAFMSVRRRLGEFRGESRFTTWAYKFAVLEVSGKVTRHTWRRPDRAVGVEDWSALRGRLGLQPEAASEWHELLAALRRAVDTGLTPLQRSVFVALMLDGQPLDVVAASLGASRGSVYKALFDARRKLLAVLVAGGHLTAGEARR